MAAAIEVLADLTDPEYQSGMPKYDAVRRLGIGGSDAPVIVGVSPYRNRTPYAVWVEKLSEATSHNESEAMSWGKILEAPVREEFVRRSGLNVVPFPRMVRNVRDPLMLASVDGLVVDDLEEITDILGVYEGKTARRDWMDDGVCTVPVHNAVQGYHYMAVYEVDIVHFACLVGGQVLRVVELERDDKLIDDLIFIEHKFWEQVENGTPPPVDGADVETLRRHWTPVAGKTVELTAELAMSLKARAQLKGAISMAQEDVKRIDADLMAFMGDATEATWKGVTAVTWRPDSKGRIQTAELEAAYPEIAAQFRGEPSRRLIPKKEAS